MEYSNIWGNFNDAMEMSLMIKHVQIIKHFEKKYGVEVNRLMTFKESKYIADAVTQIKFLKVRKIIDTNKACTLFKLISSTDQENKQMGSEIVKQLLTKIKKTA